MNLSLLNDGWELFRVIAWGGKEYCIHNRDIFLNDYVIRRRFLLVFPSGKKRMLQVAVSEEAAKSYDESNGLGSHAEVIDEMVTAEAVEAIKAAAKVHSLPKVQPDVKLVPIHDESLIYTGVDFAKVEAQMMASLMAPLLPSGHVYGPSPISGSALALMKAQKAMEESYKKLAAGFITAGTFDSLAGVSKTEAFKALYGGGQKQEQLTPKGLATLKRFGVALVG